MSYTKTFMAVNQRLFTNHGDTRLGAYELTYDAVSDRKPITEVMSLVPVEDLQLRMKKEIFKSQTTLH